MAVFLVNVCKFNNCGIKFASLQELIRHIEEFHLDFDADFSATCLPVSCVLRIFSESPSNDVNSNNESHIRKSINSLSTTPTDGSDLDGEDEDSSIDSWATNTQSDNATNHILKFHQIMGSGQNLDENNNSTKLLNNLNKEQREYICGISGCSKRYRSSNSLSHHRRSAHKFGNLAIAAKPAVDENNKKIYNCFCGKTYKTSHGLKNHCNNHHPAQTLGLNGVSCNSNQMALSSPNKLEIKQEISSAQFIQLTGTAKAEISPAIKETLLNSITKSKPLTFGPSFLASEIVSDHNCPPVSRNVEVMSESKLLSKCPPIITAPTLQQHLLSPIIPKMSTS